jgi:hypothetical protein
MRPKSKILEIKGVIACKFRQVNHPKLRAFFGRERMEEDSLNKLRMIWGTLKGESKNATKNPSRLCFVRYYDNPDRVHRN